VQRKWLKQVIIPDDLPSPLGPELHTGGINDEDNECKVAIYVHVHDKQEKAGQQE